MHDVQEKIEDALALIGGCAIFGVEMIKEGTKPLTFCDYQFKPDNSLEDFILSPLLKRWVVTTTQRFIR